MKALLRLKMLAYYIYNYTCSTEKTLLHKKKDFIEIPKRSKCIANKCLCRSRHNNHPSLKG